MNKEDTLNTIHDLGLLSVLRGPSPDLTLRMVEALVRGGVTGIEITFTTPDALEVVRELNQQYGELILLGMGTLTKPKQAASAKAAGAQFLVSPHTEEQLAKAMVATGLPVMLGALTPSEIVRSFNLGSDVVKLFPGSVGGPSYLRALRGPFPEIPIMPTGGVSEENAAEWFAAGAFAVGAGSSLCPAKLARQGRFNEISEIAQKFAATVAAVREPT